MLSCHNNDSKSDRINDNRQRMCRLKTTSMSPPLTMKQPSRLSSIPSLQNLLLIAILMLLSIQTPVGVAAKSKSKKTSNSHHNDEKPSLDGQRFAMEPQDQTAVVGSRVTLPCRVIDKVGALQWTKDDFGLGQHRNLSGFERYSMIGSDEEGDFSLDIYPLMLDDDAKYQCQVGPGPAGESGIRSRFASLTVLVPPEEPKILQGDYLVTTEEHEIELECVSVGGKPAAEITWIDGLGNVLEGEYKKEEPLADSRRVTAKSTLKLLPKKEHHNTTFTCQAQNTADRTYRSAKLTLEVKYAPKVSVSVVGGALAGGRIPEGAEVILSCQADANPQDVSYRWLINDELVTGDFTTKMVIHNVTRQYHDAIVKCEVVNSVGKSEESETLDISYGPIFRQRPSSVEADLGTTVKLNCVVDGNPQPEIEWINENSNGVVGTSTQLELKVSAETAGRYFCKATVEGFPEIGAEATIYVKRAPIITSHKVQFGVVGNRAKIDCLAFSIPKAENILWSYEGKLINMSTADPDVYIFEEQHLLEGVRAALIIRESRNAHYGKYNCTVINSYGSDSLLITLIPEPGSVPVLLVVMGSMSSVAVILMVVMLIIVYMRRNRKKQMPADVIPPDAMRGGDKLSDIKNEIRNKSYDVDYTETTSDALAIGHLTHGLPDVQMKGGTLMPLAGPVKLDERFSSEFGGNEQRYSPQCHSKGIKNADFPTEGTNGYTPFFEYALDYSSPSESSKKSGVGSMGKVNVNAGAAMNSATLPHYTNNNPSTSSSTTTGGNLSLPRNRNDLQQQQQLPTCGGGGSVVNGGNAQMNNGYLGPSLLQNGIDSRFSAIYGNPYLRTNSSILPPLPPPSTANPAITPAPPPYHHTQRNLHANSMSGIGGPNGIGVGGAGIAGSGGSSSNLTISSNSAGMVTLTPLSQTPITITATATTSASSAAVAAAAAASTAVTTATNPTPQCPSGQFILSSNSNGTKKGGSLATHV